MACRPALTNNPHFPLPDPIITTFGDALGKYSVAETAAQTRAKGTVAARNAAKVVFVGALHALKARVQQVADANPDQAEAIITSTTLAVKKTPTRQKQTFVAKYGTVSGTVLVLGQDGRTEGLLRVAVQRRRRQDVDSGAEHVAGEDDDPRAARRPRRSSSGTGRRRRRAMGDWSLPTSILVK